MWQTDLHARAEKLRDAKVTDFDGAIGCDEDVLSFDVAVQDLGGVEYARARARVERVCRLYLAAVDVMQGHQDMQERLPNIRIREPLPSLPLDRVAESSCAMCHSFHT